jgi:hypothetical protein
MKARLVTPLKSLDGLTKAVVGSALDTVWTAPAAPHCRTMFRRLEESWVSAWKEQQSDRCRNFQKTQRKHM